MKRALLLLTSLLLAAASSAAPTIESITPNSGPSSGGTLVTITGEDLFPHVVCLLPCPTTVTFGDITVPVSSESERSITVITPAHVPGVVDVIVTVAGESPVTRDDGFTFTESGDDFYELALLPIYLDGVVPGAFGAQWKTDLWLRNNGTQEVALAPWPCESQACPAVFPLTRYLDPDNSLHNLPANFTTPDGNPGRILYVNRNGSANVSFNLRFADISRSAIDRGEEMPVIREDELLTTPAQLFNVPLGPSFRVLLRVYDVEYATSEFRVTIYPQSDVPVGAVHQMTVHAVAAESGPFRTKPSYGHIDISALLNLEKVWPETARIQVEPLTPGSRYWTFLSITSNESQSVTLVTPQ